VVIDRLDRSGAAFASVMTRGGEEAGSCNGGEACNVAETAATASEMTERTAEVSGEAEQAGQHAADARENATGLNAEVDMFIATPHDRAGDGRVDVA
jgi:hypothetical protein